MSVFESTEDDHLSFGKSDDPEVEKELQGLLREEQIRDIYWSLIDHCEARGLSLFNRLDSYHLGELFQTED